ncbi:hypothetical protein DH2020_007601 [Rehmannia glutinosa]|uniref:CBS domain-containing protein n=1 Tax=Rehmannia glutinosa TaxID=99300 RepID=A0ABR0TZA7_REHGL
MQGILRAVRYCHDHVHIKKLNFSGTQNTTEQIKAMSHKKRHITSSSSSPTDHHKGFNDATMAESHTISEKGLQNTTVAQVLMTKGEEKVGSWLWCRTDDTVYDAVKRMAQNNIGSLVVLKPGEQQLIAGIFTERGQTNNSYIGYKRSSGNADHDRHSNDGTFMFVENHIRHVPVIDGKIVGMISIVDVVRAVLEQQHGEVKRLNEFIKGDYY